MEAKRKRCSTAAGEGGWRVDRPSSEEEVERFRTEGWEGTTVRSDPMGEVFPERSISFPSGREVPARVIRAGDSGVVAKEDWE